MSEEEIMIDVVNIGAIEKEINPGGILYQAILKVRCLKNQNGTILPSGMTVREFNQLENKILLQEVLKRFERGLPFSYQDERSHVNGANFFISANPDGSEHLMRMDIENNERKMIPIQEVTPEGQGKYYLQLYGY